jgi:3-phenylpropionate/trans-cinnamate dioxygenase ferredoxin subunit
MLFVVSEILLVNADGKFYAVENQCPHMGYPLYLGSLEGEVLTCGFHYARFNVATGKSLGAVTHKPLKTYKVRIQNSSILVEV